MDRTVPTQAIRQEIAKGPFTSTWESLKAYHIPSWYEDAKFGIFIHWGIYSVPAFGNEWYPRNMYQKDTLEYKHHLETYGEQSKFGYKDFIPQFTAEKFDPDHWANLFRRAGAQFVVPVAEHHDGFAMYDTAFSEWNATKMGPKRDIIGELAAAVRKQWMSFGLSSAIALSTGGSSREGWRSIGCTGCSLCRLLWSRSTKNVTAQSGVPR